MTAWDSVLGAPSPLTKTAGCGENRYVGVENYLEVYITAGCEVYIEPKDAIYAKVRMDWTLEAFYADGGITRFVDRLAAVLNIHASRFKVVAAYHGSVIVDFFISSELQTTDNDSTDDVITEIEELRQSITKVFDDGSADLGAPIMGVEGNDQLLFGTAIPAGPTTGQGFGESTAIRIEDNIWDRYQRIQEIIEKQKDEQLVDEQEQSIFGSDDDDVKSMQIAEQVILEAETFDDKQAVKFIILIVASMVLFGLVITALCIYKCFTKQRKHVEDMIKA